MSVILTRICEFATSNVIRCHQATFRNEGWSRSSMSNTYILHEEKSYKIMIDGE